jgi:hypothetical protein
MIPSLLPRLTCLLLPLLVTSCARFSVWQKSAVIVGSGGAAGTVVLYSNYASAASSVAGGITTAALGGGVSMLVDAMEATPSEINAAEAAGRRYVAALDAEALKKRLAEGKNLIAVVVPRRARSRGQGEVMVYNIKKNKVETTKVYSLRRLPDMGDWLALQATTAEYVGMVPMLKQRPSGPSVPDPLAIKVAP